MLGVILFFLTLSVKQASAVYSDSVPDNLTCYFTFLTCSTAIKNHIIPPVDPFVITHSASHYMRRRAIKDKRDFFLHREVILKRRFVCLRCYGDKKMSVYSLIAAVWPYQLHSLGELLISTLTRLFGSTLKTGEEFDLTA